MSRISSDSSNSHSSISQGPLSSETEGRISISSTIYPGSSVNHSYDSHFSFQGHHQEPTRPSMTTSTSSHHDSFIDLFSPPNSPDTLEPSHPTHDRVTSISSTVSTTSFNVNPNFYKPASWDLPVLSIPSPGSKPPVPTAPKPDFSRRSVSMQPRSNRSSSADTVKGPLYDYVQPSPPPPTSLLNPRERADRVRQTRKLAQMFGQTPGNIEAIAFSQTAYQANAPSNHLSASGYGSQASSSGQKNRHLRGAASLSVATDPPDTPGRAIWPPPEGTLYISPSGARRHSSPFTAQDFLLPDIASVSSTSWSDYGGPSRDTSELIEVGSEEGIPHSDWSGHTGHGAARRGAASPGSPTSFMDLSDEEGPGDIHSIISLETPKASATRGVPFSPSTPSLQSQLTITSDDHDDDDRRRKREKVAKLHRFLGSRVPAELVLAQFDTRPAQAQLPSPQIRSAVDTMSKTLDSRKSLIRRRRSSSAAELRGAWVDDSDRLMEGLSEREKAINVRRAIKMEKMFGVAPPQTLYHTRQTASPTTQTRPSVSESPRTREPPQSPITDALRNLNQTPYVNRTNKKTHRPGTSESTEPLIRAPDLEDVPIGHVLSDIYLHYRHSLNSLNDIIDRDDKESLVDLHDYLHGSVADHAPLQQFMLQDTHHTIPSGSKAERRRSLPSRTSMTSLNSEISIGTINTYVTPPLPQDIDIDTFQNRRRRAAKLTQFFGVDYRDLMSEILESIEKGVEEEGGRGALKPDEVQDLLQKLKRLKIKRNNLS
ncbi:hypothetical protein BXZ70DRAFT_894283 [Cristinia sonorae]|uniref:Uncharacterized protein n=1 Tax=Cristinia sonorae TaxID=1940300 RepID=A0A8K0ULS2_9AGAR|nr:hypothetical protein BXZ70DRAFT_894283 [Cristinia sonorae]